MTKLSSWKNPLAIFLFCAATVMASSAQTFTTLVKFNADHGAEPNQSSLVQGSDGDLYGTVPSGGFKNVGTFFKMTPSGVLTTIYSFCSQANCADGGTPYGGVVQGIDGNFYGTTCCGGSGGGGTVFKITPRGTLNTLFSFDFTDGGNPFGGLVQASDGNFYGTTNVGGHLSDCGTVFKITPAGAMTTLHVFCSQSGDGANPYAKLIQAANGKLYGTTAAGGSGSCGTIFELDSKGTLTILHTFDKTDGCGPFAGLVQGSDGNFYGATADGGANGLGTVFKFDGVSTLTTLHSFDGNDGARPFGDLVQATDGNLYGTTLIGANDKYCNSQTAGTGCGTIFEITTEGALTTVHTFCALSKCPDGLEPEAGLVQHTNGNFYGTTDEGGSNAHNNYGSGTVFSLSTGLGPFVKFVRDSGAVKQISGILGQGFTGTTGVFMNGTPASFTVVSDTFIRAIVPTGATTGFVTVQTPSGTLTSNVPFHVIPQVLGISSIPD